ncbi:TIGR03618 family F420-dependent PPOX class oxidoreductase [Modestobacter versicolor]|uniref:TIGR03618 family F420-dependent PPOX class oxidoreductase n=1 Tax=Modestobacter versicolor TaxID=429133 RepID=UPI0034DFC9A5
MSSPPAPPFGPGLAAFFTERHLATLTTLRADGSPHVVPVGVTFDAATGTARVITSGTSAKARHVRTGQSRVAVCQVDGRVWTTLEGTAVVRDDAASIADAEARYAARYQQPRVNPARVVLEISVDRVLGNAERWRAPEGDGAEEAR